MRHAARQILRIFLIAFAIGASSVTGYAAALEACQTQGDDSQAAHAHVAADQAVADPVQSDHDPGHQGDQPCGHVHAYCCVALAMPAVECGLSLGHIARPVVHKVAAQMPFGENVSSLFRPPRSTV